jgi:hypothetical protein
MKTINIGKDFSENPAGRTIALDGQDSGEAFRNLLISKLNTLGEDEQLEIILDDGVISYGSSFISEAFGALVRNKELTANQMLKKLVFSYDKNHRYMAFVAKKITDSIQGNTKR